MKSAVATLSLVGLASAAVPDTAYHFNRLLVGYANACQGADTISVKVSTEAVDWTFMDFDGKFTPGSPRAEYCVMVNDINRAPGGWRFAFDSATYTGKVKLSGDAKIQKLGTYLGMAASWVTNPPASVDTVKWALQSARMGEFEIADTTLDADESGHFEVTTKPDADYWSPCFFKNGTTDYFKYQLSHQTQLYWDESKDITDGIGELGPGLDLKLHMKWEECEPSLSAMAAYGTPVQKPEGWFPY